MVSGRELRAAVKFPSGDADRAFGSGEIDGGVVSYCKRPVAFHLLCQC